MDYVRSTKLWKRTLGASGGDRGTSDFRKRLKTAFEAFRTRVSELANEISNDLGQLTVHDIRHIDALWETADTVVGDDYPITPTEGFVLGSAFLLHDLGLALASYPDGIDELKQTDEWQDAVAMTLRKELGRAPKASELKNPSFDVAQLATEQVLRLRHAKRAEDLALTTFQHTSRDPAYYLLEDVDLRETYGRLVGRIAYSHWWPIEQIVGDAELNRRIGAFSDGPKSWSVHPLKLAIILRTTDACHLDSRRAPGFLRALRKPSGVAELHWRIQGYLQKPRAVRNRMEFTSTNAVPIEDREAWWVGYDLLQLADRELRDSEVVLADANLTALAVHGVAGCASAQQLAKYIPTEGWVPVDTSVRSTDVGSLVRKIGGEGLYGNNPTVPLRELIQNARDAVVARRVQTNREASWGTITVRLIRDQEEDRIEVDDEGLGMSEALLSGPLIDFGASYWESYLSAKEHPGLIARGFEPQGTYGIGFFSVFMISDRVRIVTRRPEDSINETRVLEFEDGLSARPILRLAGADERREEPGTCVSLWLREKADHADGLLAPRDYTPEMLDGPESRRQSAWRLVELCEWLCPALDANLVVDTNGTVETAVQASDWNTISAKELMHRMMLHRSDRAEILSSGVVDAVINNIRDIRSSQGELIGRAALTDPFDSHQVVTRQGLNSKSFRPPGVRTAGCFRAFAWTSMPGILLGRPTVAARTQVTPIAFDDPTAMSEWATEQAPLTRAFDDDDIKLSRFATLVRLLNGDTGNLPIAEYMARMVSFRDLMQQDFPDEIELYDASWGVAGSKPLTRDPSPHVVGVSSGRMRPIFDVPSECDVRERADHPRWDQYWMSLWGATIEAIAAAWGCRLQDVLEASEIHSKGHEEIECGVHRCVNDKIRKPLTRA